jgi:hypothetical protein
VPAFINALAHAVFTQLEAVLSRTATLTGTAFDVTAYEGVALVVLTAGAKTAGTNPTLDVKVQHCETSDGTFADITGAAFTQVTTVAGVQTLALDMNAVKKYIKVIGTLGGTDTPTFPYGVQFIGIKKYS